MFLQQLPEFLRWLLLFIAGATLASLLNWAIYGLTVFEKRLISPWQKPPDAARPRSALDRIPLLGWLRMRREADLHGKLFWLRPLLIEIAFGIFLAWFYDWSTDGGLFGKKAGQLVPGQTLLANQWIVGWFLFHSVLIALMTVATFIDFDEQTIPDWITIPGTLVAILAHALFPELRLPVVSMEMLSVQIAPLRYLHTGCAGQLAPRHLRLAGNCWRNLDLVFWTDAKNDDSAQGAVEGPTVSVWRNPAEPAKSQTR